LEDNELNM
jgi:hypothetical protein